MSQMVYKLGGDTLVWGVMASVKVIHPEELDDHLQDGWLDHPSKIFEDKPAPARRGRKPKSDATDSTD